MNISIEKLLARIDLALTHEGRDKMAATFRLPFQMHFL